MKKLLLIAALAAVALGANADGYKIEKVWEINDVSFLPVADTRQGFGMNGKFYINDKANEVIYVIENPNIGDVNDDSSINISDATTLIDYLLSNDASNINPTYADMNGDNAINISDVTKLIDHLLTGPQITTLPGGANCGITRDEAGNIIVSTATFPSVWGFDATLKVINPATGEIKEHFIPEECAILGRCDFISFAKGNLMEDGEMFITGATQETQISRIVVAGGEVSPDDCYYMNCDGVITSPQTLLNYYIDLNGDEAVLYVTRNAPLKKMLFDGDNFTGSTVALPGKGASNGTFPFVWDGMELFVYPITPNYQNGFAVAEAGAEAPIVEVPSSLSGNPNAYQANWLNAEVDEDGVTIYQYTPGANITVWRLTKE